MELIVRESGKLCSRLFDHRPVISSEIHQFLNEFETKKAKSEGRGLDASLAVVTNLTQKQIPNASLLIEDHTPRLLASLEVGARMMEKINEKRIVDSFSEARQARRKQREAAWNVFMEELCQESNQIEADYDQAKSRIDGFYGELNKQMEDQGQ